MLLRVRNFKIQKLKRKLHRTKLSFRLPRLE